MFGRQERAATNREKNIRAAARGAGTKASRRRAQKKLGKKYPLG